MSFHNTLGNRPARHHSTATATGSYWYIGSFGLSGGDSSVPALERINTAWGYIAADGKAYTYVSDYQGNIRAVVGPDGRTVQTTDHYPYGMPMATSTGSDRNRYKYSGTRSFSEPFERRRENELETSAGLNQYDFEARQYAPAIPLFQSPDPKAADYPWLNPYLYCAGNPMRYIDPDGERPTDHDAYLMAQAAYEYLNNNDTFDELLNELSKSNWNPSNLGENMTLTDGSSGLNSIVFERTVDGVTEYAYVFAGTDGITDMHCDELVAADMVPKQVQQAVDNAKEMHEAAGGAEITYIGHSLGGMQAAAASMATGDAAMTFNPAALTNNMVSKLGLGDASKVDNFVLRGASTSFLGIRFTQGGDPLYNLQTAAGRPLPGNTINIYTGSFSPRHGIKNFGRLPRFW